MGSVDTVCVHFDEGCFKFDRYSSFKRVLRESTTRFVVPSVRPSHFTFFVFAVFACPNDQPLPTCTRLYPFILTPSKLFFSLFRLLSLTKQSYFKNSVQLKMREQVYHI